MKEVHPDLESFAAATKQTLINSFSTSLTVFLVNNWINSQTSVEKERNKLKNDIFSTWSAQINPAAQQTLSVINDSLNEPKNKFAAIIEGFKTISTEDYAIAYNQCLKDIKAEFFSTKGETNLNGEQGNV